VVGTIWKIFGRADVGLLGWALNSLGIDYNYAANPMDAWFTVVLMDVWHWTPLVALLCYSGLRAIPDAFYQAAAIDRASNWAVFRYIQLPRLKSVLVIGTLLRFMDSFMIYSEPFVLTGGGPGYASDLPANFMYTYAFNRAQMGVGASSAMIMLMGVLAIIVPYLYSELRGGKNGR